MKKTLLLLILFWSSFAIAQLKPIPFAVEQRLRDGKNTPVDLFSANKNAEKRKDYTTSVTDVTILNLNTVSLEKLLLEKPKLISLSIPYGSDKIELQLYKQEVTENEFVFKEKNGSTIPIEQGVYYRGIIAGDVNSIAAISFFRDNVIGVVSAPLLGNVIVGKSKKNEYISYAEINLLGKNPFVCKTEELKENNSYSVASKNLQSVNATDKCIRIYYELTYAIYTEHNQNPQAAFEWLTGVHNNISTLYENDGIKIILHSSDIWTQPDPYTSNPFENLDNFNQNIQTSFNGDLAHLVNIPETTSVAYLDALCSPYPHAYSGASLYFEQVPVFSWTILAMTHEMGHSFGSPHTHDCFWNGNNTAIDGCGNNANPDDGCPGPIPDSGTIMSYCHLIQGVGTNFSNGFGEQPKNLMINLINQKSCIVSCSALSVENFKNGASLVIYPNPALTELHIESNQEIQKIIITDLSGKTLLKSHKQSIDVSTLALGTYIISIEINNTIINRKFVKQ